MRILIGLLVAGVLFSQVPSVSVGGATPESAQTPAPATSSKLMPGSTIPLGPEAKIADGTDTNALLETPFFLTPGYFKRHFTSPTPRVVLEPPVRLQDYVVGDKIELSLKSFMDLVLANNTDIAIQRVSVETSRNAITRAYAPFDPFVATGFTSTRTESPTGDALAGADVVNQLTQPFTLQYQQRLETGTLFNARFNTNKSSTNSQFANFNPLFTSGANFSFTQPLLRDRGRYISRLPIMIARSRLRQTEYQLYDQLLLLLTNAENVYWDMILARETLNVQEQNLAVSDQSLKRALKELELGAIPQLEIYQPQANYANAEIQVTQARYRLAQAEDAVRRQMGADLDPQLRNLTITLTEAPLPPDSSSVFDKEGLVQLAMRTRPDLRSVVQQSDIDDLNFRAATNALRPDMSLTAQYGSSGRGGTFRRYDRTDPFGPPTLVEVIPGGVGGALDQVFGFGFPTYGLSLNLRLPIRDRRAAADLADALVSKKLTALRTRNTEQTIRLQVLNAINQVENSKASVKLAQVALEFAEKRMEADQRRYDLGAINLFFLLAAQQDLNQAKSNLVNQTVQYRRNLLNLQRTTGELLGERGIQVQ